MRVHAPLIPPWQDLTDAGQWWQRVLETLTTLIPDGAATVVIDARDGVIDLHGPAWPVIRHIDAQSTEHESWYPAGVPGVFRHPRRRQASPSNSPARDRGRLRTPCRRHPTH
jgi:hypothetical protein